MELYHIHYSKGSKVPTAIYSPYRTDAFGCYRIGYDGIVYNANVYQNSYGSPNIPSSPFFDSDDHVHYINTTGDIKTTTDAVIAGSGGDNIKKFLRKI